MGPHSSLSWLITIITIVYDAYHYKFRFRLFFFSSTNLQLFRAPCYDFFSRETWAKDICRGFYCQPIQQEPLVPPSADAVRKAGESVSASAPTFPGQVGSRPGEDGFIWVLKPFIWIYMDSRSIWIHMDLKRFIFCFKGICFFSWIYSNPKNRNVPYHCFSGILLWGCLW